MSASAWVWDGSASDDAATLPEDARLLGRYSIVAAVMIALLPLTFPLVAPQPGDAAYGPDLGLLLQASRWPLGFRVHMVFETTLWIMVAGTFILVAHVVRRQAPRRASLLLVCAAGQAIGAFGGMVRLDVMAALGARYAGAAAAVQQQISASFLDVAALVNVCSHAGSLFQGLGFLAAATALGRTPGFPRAIARWMYLPAVIPLVQVVVVATGRPFVLPLLLLHVIVGLVLLHGAMAWSLRAR